MIINFITERSKKRFGPNFGWFRVQGGQKKNLKIAPVINYETVIAFRQWKGKGAAREIKRNQVAAA